MPTMLITGAASGIGAATARAAGAAGYDLVLGDRDEGPLRELADELGATAVVADVADWEDQERLAGAADTLDVVLANAGVGIARGYANESPEAWRDMILTNIYGTALTIRATVDRLSASDGHLVVTGAVTGRRPPGGSLYAATAAALGAMAESARSEIRRVTLLEPGVVHTPFFDNPQGDALRAEDVARTIMWAVSQPSHVDVGNVVLRPVAQQD